MLEERSVSQQVLELFANKEWDKIAEFFSNIEISKLLGINVDLSEPAVPRVEIMQVKPLHLGGLGQDYVNGMIVCAVLDMVLGLTGLQFADEGFFGTNSVTIHLQKPVENKAFYAVARCNRRIGNRVYSEATIFDVDHQPRVHATGMLRIGLKT